MDPDTPVRWDVYSEHLEEAAFLFHLWEIALRSPIYTLGEIAQGIEERLLAHLDGLLLGGGAVADRFLLKAMVDSDPGMPFSAAFVLASSQEAANVDLVIEGLEKATPECRGFIRRGLGVALRDDLAALLLPKLENPSVMPDLVQVLGWRNVHPKRGLESLAGSGDPARERVAIEAARQFPDCLNPLFVDRGCSSDDGELRGAALETGLVQGRQRALAYCEATLREKAPGLGTAALLLALSGDEVSTSLVLRALSDPPTRVAATFALGFSGRVSAADALLEAMSDPLVARLAGEAFGAITGLRIEKGLAQPRPAWDPTKPDEEQESEPVGPEADLPVPNATVIARWWKENRPRFDPSTRYLAGAPWGGPALLRELESGPARRRRALALDLSIRTKGQAVVTWDGLSIVQARQLAAARASPLSALSYRQLARQN